jgi:uncharacterized membrane protein YkvA (DUF1232 family)
MAVKQVEVTDVHLVTSTCCKTCGPIILVVMKLIATLKQKVRALKHEMLALYYASFHPSLNVLPKIVIGITLAYLLSPIDLIPDFIPILGYIDDLLIVPALITLCIALIPKDIMEESRCKAKNEPLELRKNKTMVILFILLLVVVLAVAIKICIEAFIL